MDNVPFHRAPNKRKALGLPTIEKQLAEKNMTIDYFPAHSPMLNPAEPIGGLIKHNLGKSYCCFCYYQTEQEKAEEYSDYQQVYQQKLLARKANYQQYQLLRSYQGCKQCGSLAVDAYYLYEENKLICQPCRMKKEGSASGAISFLEQNSNHLASCQCLEIEAQQHYSLIKDNLKRS
ncbi:13512_t:CDS:2 [Funneliformis geosporum]|uniref:14946_t:CDS:1 n=1 Tax=Funneliformis geosporum TaxID=1117311 RepID=A0A9W4X082_9GLOM|nr:13512_t:CDS:2 [Funneliformis geosporum]CAI2176769.1 14946_t:CDS:2 [Funneliformis geosporum]